MSQEASLEQLLYQFLQLLGLRWRVECDVQDGIPGAVQYLVMREDRIHKLSIAPFVDGRQLPRFFPFILRSLCRAKFAEDVDPILGHSFIYHRSGRWSDTVMSELYRRQAILSSATGHIEMWAADLCNHHWPDTIKHAVSMMDEMVAGADHHSISHTLNYPGGRLDLIHHIAFARRFALETQAAHLLALEEQIRFQYEDIRVLASTCASVLPMPNDPVDALRVHGELTAAHCKLLNASFVPTFHRYDDTGWHDWDTGMIEE